MKLNTADFDVIIGLEISKMRLHLEYTYEHHVVLPEIRNIINKAWLQKLSQVTGTSAGVADVFPLYRYKSHKISNSDLTIYLGATDYRETYGTNIANPNLATKYGPDVLGNALAICGLILGSDNSILLFRRSEIVHEKPGWWHTIGGHLERSKLHVLQHPDPSYLLRHEVEEELPNTHVSIISMKPVCFVRPTASHKPEICYLINTDLPLHAKPKIELNFEHSDYTILPCNLIAITTFLERNWDNVVGGTKAALFHLCLLRFNREAVNEAWNIRL